MFVIMERINSQSPREAVLVLLQCRKVLRAEAKPSEEDSSGWVG